MMIWLNQKKWFMIEWCMISGKKETKLMNNLIKGKLKRCHVKTIWISALKINTNIDKWWLKREINKMLKWTNIEKMMTNPSSQLTTLDQNLIEWDQFMITMIRDSKMRENNKIQTGNNQLMYFSMTFIIKPCLLINYNKN